MEEGAGSGGPGEKRESKVRILRVREGLNQIFSERNAGEGISVKYSRASLD